MTACSVSLRSRNSATVGQCNVVCSNMPITSPASDDGCCPRGANIGNDNDCEIVCGDGVVSAGETCEPKSKDKSCPTSCNDGDECTTDMMTGDASRCTAKCSNSAVKHTGPTSEAECDDDDPCTADSIVQINACSAKCSNTAVKHTGPTSAADCNDSNPCTQDLVATVNSCTSKCSSSAITQPMSGDGCCPSGVSSANDTDCPPVCGNGMKEAGEECDPKATGEVVGYSCDTSCRRLNRLTPCTDELPGQCQGAPPSICDSGFCRPTCPNLQLNSLCEPLPGATRNESTCTGSEPRACAWLCSIDDEDAYCGPSLWCDGTYCRVKP